MKNRILWVLLIGCLWSFAGCQPKATPEEYNAKAAEPERYHQCVKQLTDVIIHDIFSPPVASRIYGYANLAGYEAMLPGQPGYESLAGKLRKFTAPPKPEPGQEYCFPLASTRAFLTVGRNLTFSGDMFDGFEKDFYEQYKAIGVPDDVIERSMAYGEAVAKHIMEFAGKDSYKQTRGFKHTVTNAEGTWVPTPPAYMEAAEPKWMQIRCWVMDTCSQFIPPPAIPYNMTKGSPFYKLADEVYQMSLRQTEEERKIAFFWDDNAFVMNVAGHVSYASKKMTPGGHWLAIAATASRQQKANFAQTVQAYTLTAFALADGFISCWDEKYRSNRIRPETVINKFIDPKWTPYLQTPPFPEYTSGHSVISAAAAEVLTILYGDNIAFTDSTENPYGHGVRSFKSFREAALEASYSRLYGGIHFRDALELGNTQGRKVGEYVVEKLTSKKEVAVAPK
ncbi:vanadium-dependent haloperoxidase [Larkinella punicea]|uniref:Phosphatase PAP2 family protein n=1 Tax=Larkinella punicea TaxID=2315727 RepID=A0A368JGN3_9BACT|nr:vanadium-dependent haloperoxidase [Larkinella punicea]RCR65703.1 phosphatase PAP2 family protein [Larkinella punicea]